MNQLPPVVKFVPLMLVIWGVLTFHIGAPWYGIQEAPRIWVPAAVRNYRLYGLDQTGLMIVRSVAPAAPETFQYYTHHPPLIIWLPALSTLALGFNELGVRFVFIAVTFISAAAFYVFVRRLYGESPAWLATAVYGLVPLVAYYGRVPGHDQIGLAVVLMFAAVLVNWLRDTTRRRLWALILLAWLAVWSAWTAVFFVAALGLAALGLGNTAHRAAIVGIGLLMVAAFAVLLGFYQVQWSGSVDSILNAFIWRTSSASNDPGTAPFTALEFVTHTLAHLLVLVTPGVLVTSIWGALALARHGPRFANTFTFALFAGALAYQLVFRNASFVHDYYKIVFAPSMAIATAGVWAYTRSGRIARPVFAALLIVSLAAGAGVLIWLHHSNHRPWLSAVIDIINTRAAHNDLVMTHLEGKNNIMPLEFYTSRSIDDGLSFDEAAHRAGQSGQRVFYIDCPAINDADPPQNQAGYTFIEAASCRVYILR